MSPNVDLQVKWYTHAQLRKKFQQRFGGGGSGVLDGGSTTRMDVLIDRGDPSGLLYTYARSHILSVLTEFPISTPPPPFPKNSTTPGGNDVAVLLPWTHKYTG